MLIITLILSLGTGTYILIITLILSLGTGAYILIITLILSRLGTGTYILIITLILSLDWNSIPESIPPATPFLSKPIANET